jgi:hypothetical protein
MSAPIMAILRKLPLNVDKKVARPPTSLRLPYLLTTSRYGGNAKTRRQNGGPPAATVTA